MNRGIGMLAIVAGLFGEDAWPKRKPIIIDGEEREDYELHEEYEKIQRKESKLSRSERDRIVYRYERRQEELSAARREIQEPTMSTTAHIAYSDAIITALRNDPGLSRTDAIYQTIPDYLTWTWSHKVGAVDAEPVGGGDPPEGAYLEDHELDRVATPKWALDEYDALDETEQEQIREMAESAELERR